MFEYRKPQKKKQTKLLRNKYNSKDLLERDSREFKVRVIEKLSDISSHLETRLSDSSDQRQAERSAEPSNERGFNIDQYMNLGSDTLEALNRQFFLELTGKMFEKMRKILPKEEIKRIINALDENGAALLHYFSALDYYEVVSLFKQIGADLNVKSWNGLTPLFISASRGNEKTVSKLVYYGVEIITQSRPKHSHTEDKNTSAELSRSSKYKVLVQEEEKEHDALKIALHNNHHGIVEMLLRDVTLNKEMNKENKKRDNSLLPPMSKEFKRSSSGGIQYNCIATSLGVINDDSQLNTIVMRIQKNVRGWLLRRQHHDIKHATQVLHTTINHHIKNSKERPLDKKRAAILIQRTVRQWLNNVDSDK